MKHATFVIKLSTLDTDADLLTERMIDDIIRVRLHGTAIRVNSVEMLKNADMGLSDTLSALKTNYGMTVKEAQNAIMDAHRYGKTHIGPFGTDQLIKSGIGKFTIKSVE